MKIVVIYHKADYDGVFCREIARKFLPDAQLIGWDYGDPTPAKAELNGTKKLYMLDISVEGLMFHPQLVWIDHHKSSIESYPEGIPGYRIDGVAACRLAWMWFTNQDEDGILPLTKNEYVERLVREPLAVRLAGEYDVWDKRDPRAELFQHGLRSRELSEFDWRQMLSTEKPTMEEFEKLAAVGMQNILEPDGTMIPPIVAGLLENGKAVQYAQTKQNESIIKELGFTFHWEGLTFLACNHARCNSHLFTASLTPEHDACFGFKWTGKDWSVSLYHALGKEHHDLSLIAVKYNGGGHRGACGFRTNKLPFL